MAAETEVCTFPEWENATSLYSDTYNLERVRTLSRLTHVSLISSEAEDLLTFCDASAFLWGESLVHILYWLLHGAICPLRTKQLLLILDTNCLSGIRGKQPTMSLCNLL